LIKAAKTCCTKAEAAQQVIERETQSNAEALDAYLARTDDALDHVIMLCTQKVLY